MFIIQSLSGQFIHLHKHKVENNNRQKGIGLIIYREERKANSYKKNKILFFLELFENTRKLVKYSKGKEKSREAK